MINKFITFEGGEGAGKTTQIKLLAEYFQQQNQKVIITREPGGTPNGEAIRELFLSSNKFEPMTEALLNFAARLEHVEKVIKPALSEGQWVLCDRFFDSTYVYQGYAEGVSLDAIKQLKDLTLGKFMPNKTIILDIDPVIALKRAEERGEINRFEKMGLPFHQKIRNGFLALANSEPNRFHIIDATEDSTTIHKQIKSLLQQ